MQRLAHEELGLGEWTSGARTVPLAQKGAAKLGILDVTDPEHPSLCVPPPSKSEADNVKGVSVNLVHVPEDDTGSHGVAHRVTGDTETNSTRSCDDVIRGDDGVCGERTRATDTLAGSSRTATGATISILPRVEWLVACFLFA